MSTDFKFTGHPQPGHTANISGSGVAILGPGAGKYITIFDVLASESTLLREQNGTGPVLAYIPSGAVSLSASITGGMVNGTGCQIINTTGNVTITYGISRVDY
tara:strand:- start:284 stop:592 length:309 start_codon:yes stop_codon:yes gene_type:complete